MSAAYPSGDLALLDLPAVLRILGDPVRFAIVQRLLDGQVHAKSAEEWGFGLQKSALAHHFKTLRESGITEVVVSGRTHGMRLRIDQIQARFPGLLAALDISGAAAPPLG